MPLSIIIDGYNLLGALGKKKSEEPTDGAGTREALIPAAFVV